MQEQLDKSFMYSNNDTPLISTIMLSWNRPHLLKAALESYMATISMAHELWIADNASDADTQDVIAQFIRAYPQAHLVTMETNRGAEAYNVVLPHVRGEWVVLAENDQCFLPGWCEKLVQVFTHYPQTGQFCLQGPGPKDNEIGTSKSVTPFMKNGCFVYQQYNAGAGNSAIPRNLFANGLTIANRVRGPGVFVLNQRHLAEQLYKNMDKIIACNNRPLVDNLGHRVEEIRANRDYYIATHAKVGLEDWQDYESFQHELQSLDRHSVTFPDQAVLPEAAVMSTERLNARYWSMFDTRTPEVETVDWIYALVRMQKPSSVLETRSWLGHVTLAVAKALAANRVGVLTSLEINTHTYEHTQQRLQQAGLAAQVRLKLEESDRFSSEVAFDMAIFNSSLYDKEEEFFYSMHYLADGATVLIFNEKEHKEGLPSLPQKLERLGLLSGQYLSTARGVYMGRFRKPDAGNTHKRLVCCLSAGRSGTYFLNMLLKNIDGIVALHEPEPRYQWHSPSLQQEITLANDFVRYYKKPWIDILPGHTYLEASHYMAKGYMEAWLAEQVVFDAIILRRPARDIAKSWYLLGADFHQDRHYVMQHMLHPEDNRRLYLPLAQWERFNNYQLCYWYALENEARQQHYRDVLHARGARLFDTSLSALTQESEVERLLAWLNIALTPAQQAEVEARCKKVVNEKSHLKKPERQASLKTLDLDALEAEITRYV